MERVARDYRGEAGLAARERALCDFADRATRAPARLGEADVSALRTHGLDDDAISSAVQVVAYFNYVNRVADAIGIEPEPEWGELG